MVFILSLRDLQGDNSLVILTEDWTVLKEYTGEKLGFYQLLSRVGNCEIQAESASLRSTMI